MLPYIREFLEGRLDNYFAKESREEVVSWLIAAQDRRAVIVVGAGFSKNAVWKSPKEGSARDAIPDWGQVDKLLKDDLKLEPEASYGLMLPDLYTAQISKPKYHDILLKRLPDDEIKPGPVHEALFNLYRPEAVITTNQLDTLLDRGLTVEEIDRRWFRVQDDTALAQPDAEKRVQLIYLHGHRSMPRSWVFGLSQYEDLDRNTPVMMRRVRQLLAQHPVLFVGFSLTDPNFHALVRQIDREMCQGQPKNLAIMVDPQPPAFVKLWSNYGVQIATFKKKGQIEGGFIQLFKELTIVGRDRRAGEGELESTEVKKKLLGLPSFRERVALLGEMLKNRALPLAGLKADNAKEVRKGWLELWREIAFPTNVEDRMRVVEGRKFGKRSDFPGRHWGELNEETRSKIIEEGKYSFLGKLPQDRFSDHLRENRNVASLLKRGISVSDVVAWLQIWFDEMLDIGFEPEESGYDELPVVHYCDLLSWSCVKLSEAEESETQRCMSLIQRCAEIARRYGDPSLSHIRGDWDTIAPREDLSQPGLVEMMKEASSLVLDAKFKEAIEIYLEVRGEARTENRPWFEWLALEGAVRILKEWKGAAKQYEAQLSALKERCENLSNMPEISSWRKRLEERSRETLEKAFQKRISDERNRSQLSHRKVLTYKYRPRNPLMSWSDLHENGAAPWQISKLLDWALPARLFSEEEEEFELRLQYGVKETDKWLKDLAFQAFPAKRERRMERDCNIMGLLLGSKNKSLTRKVAALHCIGGIELFVQRSQVDALAELLISIKLELGSGTIQIYNGTHTGLGIYYAKAWEVYASLVTTEEQLKRLNEYILSIEDRNEMDEVLGNAAEYHWRRWAQLFGTNEVMKYALDWREHASKMTTWRCADSMVCEAAEACFSSEKGNGVFTDAIVSEVLKSALLAAQDDGRYRSDSKQSAVSIARYVADDTTKFLGVVNAAYPNVLSRGGLEGQDCLERSEDLVFLLLVCLDRDDMKEEAKGLFSRLLSVFDSLDESSISSIRSNLYSDFTTRVLQATSAYCSHEKTEVPSADRFLELIEVEPSAVSSLAPVLSEKFWPKHWPKIKALVLQLARPSIHPESQQHQAHIAVMLGGLLKHKELAKAAWLVPVWTHGLVSSTSEQSMLANHQSALTYRFLKSGLWEETSELWKIAKESALAAASDPRTVIRIGVSSLHRDLPEGDPEMTDLKEHLKQAYENESYAAARFE